MIVYKKCSSFVHGRKYVGKSSNGLFIQIEVNNQLNSINRSKGTRKILIVAEQEAT